MEYIPMCLYGHEFEIPGDIIEFRYGKIVEVIRQRKNGVWTYTQNKHTVRISKEDMLPILFGWFAIFDRTTDGYCRFRIRVSNNKRDPGTAWVVYRN